VSQALGDDLYLIASYVLIIAGALLVVVSMFGCCGALRESRPLLGVVCSSKSVFVSLGGLSDVQRIACSLNLNQSSF